MKRVAFVVVALGMLLAMATPSLAHGVPVYHHHHGYAGPYYYGGYSPVVVAPAPVYSYPTYAPVVTPVVTPVITPVVPGPYYYRAPSSASATAGRGVAVRVGL